MKFSWSSKLFLRVKQKSAVSAKETQIREIFANLCAMCEEIAKIVKFLLQNMMIFRAFRMDNFLRLCKYKLVKF